MPINSATILKATAALSLCTALSGCITSHLWSRPIFTLGYSYDSSTFIADINDAKIDNNGRLIFPGNYSKRGLLFDSTGYGWAIPPIADQYKFMSNKNYRYDKNGNPIKPLAPNTLPGPDDTVYYDNICTLATIFSASAPQSTQSKESRFQSLRAPHENSYEYSPVYVIKTNPDSDIDKEMRTLPSAFLDKNEIPSDMALLRPREGKNAKLKIRDITHHSPLLSKAVDISITAILTPPAIIADILLYPFMSDYYKASRW